MTSIFAIEPLMPEDNQHRLGDAATELVSDGPRSPVQLGFPITVLDRWLPRLYPGPLS